MEIDSSCFKAFQAAAEVLNFTEAARLSGMTQSGVSQHIAKLEKDVGADLFIRVGKKVLLTSAGKTLLNFIEEYHDRITTLKDTIHESSSSLKGKIAYAMPATCLISPHFALFLKERKKNFPEIELHVDIHASDVVIDKVLKAEIDFGFVTKKQISAELDYEPFCEEEYVLVSAKENAKNFRELNWISYPGSDVLHEAWLMHHKLVKQNDFKDKIGSRTNSLPAALTMVVHGLGIMIVPRHCIDTYEHSALLKVHELGKRPCINMIYIVSLKSYGKPMRVTKAVEAFARIKN